MEPDDFDPCYSESTTVYLEQLRVDIGDVDRLDFLRAYPDGRLDTLTFWVTTDTFMYQTHEFEEHKCECHVQCHEIKYSSKSGMHFSYLQPAQTEVMEMRFRFVDSSFAEPRIFYYEGDFSHDTLFLSWREKRKDRSRFFVHADSGITKIAVDTLYSLSRLK